MIIRRAIIRDYDKATHTATIEVWGGLATWLENVPVSHQVNWWNLTAGTQCAALFFDDTDQQDAVIVATYSGTQPRDPRFDPSTGHKHRGVTDDGPTL